MQRPPLKPLTLNTRQSVELLIQILTYDNVLQRNSQRHRTLTQIRVEEIKPGMLSKQLLLSSTGETYLTRDIKGMSLETIEQYAELKFFNKENGSFISLYEVVEAFASPNKKYSSHIITNLVYNKPLAEALLSGHYGVDEILRISARCCATLREPILPLMAVKAEVTVDHYRESDDILPYNIGNLVPNKALTPLLRLSFQEKQERKHRIAFTVDPTQNPKIKQQQIDLEDTYQDMLAVLNNLIADEIEKSPAVIDYKAKKKSIKTDLSQFKINELNEAQLIIKRNQLQALKKRLKYFIKPVIFVGLNRQLDDLAQVMILVVTMSIGIVLVKKGEYKAGLTLLFIALPLLTYKIFWPQIESSLRDINSALRHIDNALKFVRKHPEQPKTQTQIKLEENVQELKEIEKKAHANMKRKYYFSLFSSAKESMLPEAKILPPSMNLALNP